MVRTLPNVSARAAKSSIYYCGYYSYRLKKNANLIIQQYYSAVLGSLKTVQFSYIKVIGRSKNHVQLFYTCVRPTRAADYSSSFLTISGMAVIALVVRCEHFDLVLCILLWRHGVTCHVEKVIDQWEASIWVIVQ